MLWVGGGQGAGKTTLSWRLSRAHDLPLHRIDMWTYDHQARMPAADSLEEQLVSQRDAVLTSRIRASAALAGRPGSLWMRAAALTVMPAFPFGCECGESGCRATWAATPDDYAARTASGRRLIAHDIP